LLNNKENGANYQSVADVALTNAEPESDFRKPSKTKELNTDANLNPILPSDSKNNAVTNNPIIRPSQWLSRNNLSDAAEFVLEKVRNNKVARKAMVEVFQHPYFTALSLCALKFFKMEGSEVNEENVAEFMINLCEKGHENISKLQGGNDLKYCSTVNNELLVLGFMKDDSLMNAFYTQSKELSGAIGFSNKGLKFGAAALSHMGGQEFGEDALNGLLRNIESDELAAARLNIEVGLRKERAKLFEDKKSKVVTSWADDKVTELAKIKSGGDQILQRIFDSRQDKGVVLGKNSLMVSSVMVVTGKKCSDWKEKMSQPSQLTDLTWITSLLGSLRADYDDDKKAQAKEDIMKELYTSAHAIQTKHRFAISNPKTHEDLSVLQDLAAIFLVFDHKQDASLVRLFNPNFKNEDHDESENASKQIYETIEKKINDLRVNLDISPAPAVANSSGGVRFSNAYSSNNRNH
jgi:hypothetical protein